VAPSEIGLMAMLLLAQENPWDTAPAFYHARIVVEEGVAPPVSPQIIPDPPVRCIIGEVFGNGQVNFEVPLRSSGSCPVTIRLAGYRKNQAILRNEAVIVMKRPGNYANSTVSLTTLQAPEQARKAYEKGVAAMLGKKWDSARKELEGAVAVYPEYAPAWNALGEVRTALSQPQQAQEAFERAAKADPKFAPAWAHLAHIAAGEGRVNDTMQAAERVIQLDPKGYPDVYADLALADLALKRPEAAEKSARRAVELDTLHEIPRTERVLGSVLAAKGDQKGAIEHWQKYLEMSPKAEDAAEVRDQIARAEAAPSPTPPPSESPRQ